MPKAPKLEARVWNVALLTYCLTVLVFPKLLAGARPEDLEASANASASALSICDALQNSMPNFASDSHHVQDDPVDASCVIQNVEARNCMSTNPLWVCAQDSTQEKPTQPAGRTDMGPSSPDAAVRNGSGGGGGAPCRCMWRPVCHGIHAAFGEDFQTHLACRSDLVSSACQCWGFKSCETKKDADWTCEYRPMAAPGAVPGDAQRAPEAQLVLQFLQHALRENVAVMSPNVRLEQNGESQSKLANTSALMLRAGSCLCNKAKEGLVIPLSSREFNVLQRHPYDEATVHKPHTAAGKTIEEKGIESDDNGKERLTLTISDDKNPEKRAQKHLLQKKEQVPVQSRGIDSNSNTTTADGNATAKDEDERCVITDGEVSLSHFNFIMIGLMILPAVVAALFVLSSSCLSHMCLSPRTALIQREDRPAQLATAAPPWIFTILIVLLMVLMKMNVSSILTTAHVIVDHVERSGGLPKQIPAHSENPAAQLVISGLLLASEPLGGILGVVIAARHFISRPKVAMLGSCAILCCSSLLLVAALRQNSLVLMALLRFGSGIAEGSLFIGHLYLTRLSSPEMRTQIFGYWETGTAAGLVGGPALASVASVGPWTVYLGGTGEACACMIALLAVCLFFAIASCCPAESVLRSSELANGTTNCWFDWSMTADQMAVQFMLTGSTIVRLFLRLAWEATSVMVLASHFCLGHQKAGYGIVATFGLYMAAQSLFMLFCKNYSDHALVRFCEVIGIIGLLLLFRSPAPVEQTLQEDVLQNTSWSRLGIFLIGSALFYTGNCMTAGPLSSWATKHGPSNESLLLWIHLAIHFGVCAGAFLSRIFISMDPHQNVMVVMLLPVVIVQMLLSELGMRYSNDTRKDCD